MLSMLSGKLTKNMLYIDGGGRHLIFQVKICIPKVTVAICVRLLTFPVNLVGIGPIVKKKQPSFEIRNGGIRHLEFWLRRPFDNTDAFYVRFSLFQSALLKIGPKVKK